MSCAEIIVVGLGSGDENQLTLGVWKQLQSGKTIYLRTDAHPVVDMLRSNGLIFQSFDSVYEGEASFNDVYEAISQRLIDIAKKEEQPILYAVPGHPMVAEYTVQLLKLRCPDEHIRLRLLGGESFLDEAFLKFGFDPIEGFQLLDGSDIDSRQLNPRMHTVIAQVYDSLTASDVKLSLMERYPDDYMIKVGHALGVDGQERMETIPLYELDRVGGYGNLTLVWVPRSEEEHILNRSFERLHEIVGILRSPEGCPWDREQTHASLRKHLIEETYEVLETIDDDDTDAMCEELGDLLLQVMLHSQIEEETGVFTVYDVIRQLNEKLVRRHPHVFGDKEAGDAEEALQNWQQVKTEEKQAKQAQRDDVSVLSGVPRDLPGLMKAVKLQKKAADVGFDWDDIADVFAKVEEELGELKEAHEQNLPQADKIAELGDVLFAVVNAARFMRVDPEAAITATNRKFMQRFSYIEQQLRLSGKSFAQTNLIEMEQLWEQAKKLSTNAEQ